MVRGLLTFGALALSPFPLSAQPEAERAAADASFSKAAASPLGTPLPPDARPPEPAWRTAPLPAYRERAIALLEKGFLHPEGVSREAKAEASRLLREMHRGTPLETLERLASCKPSFLLVPRGRAFTEFEEYKWVAAIGQAEAFGIVGTVPGHVLGAVREEALLDEAGNWPRGGVMVHEWAHVVHFCLLMGVKSELVQSSFDRHFESGKAFTNAYAQLNEREHFAESVSLWFGMHDASGATDGSDGLDAGWLQRQDYRMYFLLDALFGPPRDLFLPTSAGSP